MTRRAPGTPKVPPGVSIGAARGRERAAIRDLLLACFPGPEEAGLVARLEAERDAVLSLVARAGRVVIGHVLFSRLAASFPALALAPLAVAAAHRRQGIGAALVHEGLARAAAAGWRAVFVLGEPAYYGRFGFDPALARGFASPYAGPHLMAVALGGPLPATSGRIEHAPAFGTLG